MTLNITATSENSEVAALKDKVREVANKYAKRHSWCSVVNAALKECGIDPDPPKIRVQIEFSVAGSKTQTAIKNFRISDLAGKDDTAQKVWVANEIAPTVEVAGTKVLLPVVILDLSEAAATARSTNVLGVVPDGYVGRFLSDEGRVKHLIREGDLAHYGRRKNFLCGQYSYYPSETSSRDEGRICAKCSGRSA